MQRLLLTRSASRAVAKKAAEYVARVGANRAVIVRTGVAIAAVAGAAAATVSCVEYPTRVVKPHSVDRDPEPYEELYQANSTTREGTQKMSVEEYVRAIVDPSHKLSDGAIRRARSRVLEILGLPKDAMLEKADFVLVMCLAATPTAALSEKLGVFSKNEHVTREGFLNALAATTGVVFCDDDSAALRQVFGLDGSRVITRDQTLNLARDLRHDMFEMGFRVCDRDGKGYVFVNDVVKTLSPHVPLPSFMLKATVGNRRLNLEQYVGFHELLDCAAELQQDIETFGRVRHKVKRDDVKRLIAKAHGMPATEAATDLVLDYFGSDNEMVDRARFDEGMSPVKGQRPPVSLWDEAQKTAHKTMFTTGLATLLALVLANPVYQLKNIFQSNPGLTFKAFWHDLKGKGFWGGIRYMYSGLGPQAAFIVPDKMLKFTVFEVLKILQKGDREKLEYWEAGYLAMLTAFFQSATTTPMERFMILKQVYAGPGRPPTVWMLVNAAWARGGIRELRKFAYQGWRATLMRDMPFNLIFFGGREVLNDILPKDWNPVAQSCMVGIVFGGIAGALDTPADRIKTVLQNDKVQYNGIVHAMRDIRKEGYKGFFKGWGWRVLTIGVMFGAVSLGQKYFEERWFGKGTKVAPATVPVGPFQAAVAIIDQGTKPRTTREH